MKKLLMFVLFFLAFSFSALSAVHADPSPTASIVSIASPSASPAAGLFSSAVLAIVFFGLWAISEILANCFPKLAANSFFQLLLMGLTKAKTANPMPGSSSSGSSNTSSS